MSFRLAHCGVLLAIVSTSAIFYVSQARADEKDCPKPNQFAVPLSVTATKEGTIYKAVLGLVDAAIAVDLPVAKSKLQDEAKNKCPAGCGSPDWFTDPVHPQTAYTSTNGVRTKATEFKLGYSITGTVTASYSRVCYTSGQKAKDAAAVREAAEIKAENDAIAAAKAGK